MSNLQIFNYQSSNVRTIIKNGQPWFVAKDICDILEINSVTDSVKRLSETMKATSIVSTQFGDKEMNVISEAGVYKLVFTSRKPEAEKFTDWVASEVIPSIRKTGSYSTNQFNIPQTLPEALRLAADLAEQNQILLPKAEQFDKFMSGENLQDMNTAAKVLGWGRNKLFKELKDRKILRFNNTPYQEYIDRNYFVVKEKPIQMGDNAINYCQTYLTAKGIDYLSKILVA